MKRNAKKIAVFCSGSGTNLEALLTAEKKGRLGAVVALVVCDNPGAFAIVRANRRGKPVALIEPARFASRAAFDRAVVAVLKKSRIDFVVLAGFMRILTPAFLSAWRGRILNIHPSLLPAFRGAHAIRDAFAYGAGVTGVTVHFVTEELDAGPVILQEPVAVRLKDTPDSLEAKIHRIEHRLYPEAVRLFAAGRLKVKGRRVVITKSKGDK